MEKCSVKVKIEFTQFILVKFNRHYYYNLMSSKNVPISSDSPIQKVCMELLFPSNLRRYKLFNSERN